MWCSFGGMRVTRLVVVAAMVAGVAALPASAKEGVVATLQTKIPLDAKPGTPLRVVWTLTYAEGNLRGRPFGAGALYVRLRNASGGRAETAFGVGRRGKYSAIVRVPAGGIGDIQFGLVGWVSDARGTRRADMLFPITNDPLPGPPRRR